MRFAAALAFLAGCQFSPSLAAMAADAGSDSPPAIDAPGAPPPPGIDAPAITGDAAGFATPALIQAKDPGYTTTGSLAIALDLTAGDLVVAATYTSDLDDAVAVTDTAGLAWKPVAAIGADAPDKSRSCAPSLQLWYAAVVATGSDTVTLAQARSFALGMELVEYAGLVTDSPVDQSGGQVAPAASATCDTGAITTTDRDVLVAVFADLQNTGTMAAGSGIVARGVDTGFYAMYGDDAPGVPPGSYALTAHLPEDADDDCWSASVLALRVATE